MTRGEFKNEWLDNLEMLYYLGAFCESPPNEHYFLPSIVSGNVMGRQGEAVNLALENPEVAENMTANFANLMKVRYPNDPEEVMAQRIIVQIFEAIVEPLITNPTFIIDFPKAVSPLSKASPENPQVAERFELFINGMEVANGFSELNDPREQLDRFNDQAAERERGDDEAMVLDEDYIRALSYGMPPAAGIGIGIDRLVMLLTNRQSIRDVILFPHMRPEKNKGVEETPVT
jgi:lysyl-tRNA synthetase class 2